MSAVLCRRNYTYQIEIKLSKMLLCPIFKLYLKRIIPIKY